MDEASRILNIDWLRATGAEPQWFGLGFVQLKLNKEERVHFWHPDFCPDVGDEEIHDHRYTFQSDILKGSLTQAHYKFVDLPEAEATHVMSLVSCDPKNPAPVADRYGRAEETHFETLAAGSTYLIKAGQFHTTQVFEPTVTYICRDETEMQYANVVRPKGAEVICAFSNPKEQTAVWDMIAAVLGASSKPGYHLADIKKGVLGEPSKILEEVEEFVDATTQGVDIMALVELSDLVGAIEAYLQNKHPTINLDDLRAMSRITSRAFQNGRR